MPARRWERLLRGGSGVLVALGSAALPLLATGGACPCCTPGSSAGSASGLHPLVTALPFLLFAASAILLRLSRPAGAPPAGDMNPAPPPSLSTPANEPAG
jgi:hypothetical protein